MAELSELSRTPEVDWGSWVSHNKGKGLELALEPLMGQGSQKCDTCEWCEMECMRPHVTLHATLYQNSDPCSPSTNVHFQDPYFVSITFLFSILTSNLDSIFGTLYA